MDERRWIRAKSDAPCQGQNWLSENRPYLESLDTDPGFIRIGLFGESESESEVGGGLWERRGGRTEEEGRKNFCEKISSMRKPNLIELHSYLSNR